MDYRSNYVPKNKKKANYKIVVPFVLLAGLLIYAIYTLIVPSSIEKDGSFSICNSTQSETVSLISSLEFPTGNIDVADYGTYGQTIGLYASNYSLVTNDRLSGKTIFMNNLCSGVENLYMMNQDLDNKIPMEVLENGFYQLKVLDGLNTVSLTSKEPINESFYSISKDGYQKKIRLISDKSLFKSNGTSIHDLNYVFMEVSSVETNSNDYDIVIDPAGLTINDNDEILKGASSGTYVESDITFEIAEIVKSELSNAGLKVALSRDNLKPINTFGSNGRIDNGYKMNSKYFISLTVPQTQYPDDGGITVMYSNNSSNKLATNILKQIVSQTALIPSSWSNGRNIDGVYRTGIEQGFDVNDIIRESGGKFTGAGSFNKEFAELNKKNSLVNRGMQSVIVELGFIDKKKDIELINSQKEEIGKAIAQGILVDIGYK